MQSICICWKLSSFLKAITLRTFVLRITWKLRYHLLHKLHWASRYSSIIIFLPSTVYLFFYERISLFFDHLTCTASIQTFTYSLMKRYRFFFRSSYVSSYVYIFSPKLYLFFYEKRSLFFDHLTCTSFLRPSMNHTIMEV